MARPHKTPSKYDPKFKDELIEYFSQPPYRKVIKRVSEKIESPVGSGNFETRVAEIEQFGPDGRPILEAADFPTLAGFAIRIGVHRDTLHEWSKNFADFSDAYKKAKDYQENWLAVNGNRGLIPPAFGIFTAKNVIQWRDKQPDEVDVVINNHALSDDQLDNKIESLLKKSKKKDA